MSYLDLCAVQPSLLMVQTDTEKKEAKQTGPHRWEADGIIVTYAGAAGICVLPGNR